MRSVLVVLCLGVALWAHGAGAQDLGPEGDERCAELGLDDAAVVDRLRDIRGSIARHEDDMRRWWSGFLVFHVVVTGVSLVFLLTAEDDTSRIDQGIQTVSSAIGVASILVTTPALIGAGGRLDAMPDGSSEERRRKLVLAESLLRASADGVSDIRGEISGLVSAGYGLVSSIALVGIGRPVSAIMQAAGSAVVGTARSLLCPWGIRGEWRRYRRAHRDAGCPLPPEILSARLAPRWSLGVGAGLSFTLSF